MRVDKRHRSECCASHCERMDDRRHAAPHSIIGRDSEAAGPHQLHGGAVADAAACEAAPRLEQFVLARREEPRTRAHMFDEQQLPVRAEYACDLAERAFGLVDGAKRECRNDGVHGLIGEW